MAAEAYTKFVVLSSQRSGSTWVIDVLNKLDETSAYGELLLNQKRDWDVGAVDYPRFAASAYARSARRPFSVFRYLDALYSKPGHVGFKLMYSHLRTYPEAIAYLRWRVLPVVHLVRRNALDIVVSSALKKMNRRPHLLKGQEIVRSTEGTAQVHHRRPEAEDVVQVVLDPGRLPSQLRWLQRKVALARLWLRRSGQPYLEVAYEDLKGDKALFGDIQAFLKIGSEGCLPHSELVQIRRGPHADVIRNYDEVKAALEHTPFAHLIH